MSSSFALIVSRRLQPIACALLLLAAAQLASVAVASHGGPLPEPVRGALRP